MLRGIKKLVGAARVLAGAALVSAGLALVGRPKDPPPDDGEDDDHLPGGHPVVTLGERARTMRGEAAAAPPRAEPVAPAGPLPGSAAERFKRARGW